ncbi:MAG TPA: pyridine nucleotide-disulfide oxidoreductase, partial [Dongiaceae bacterium]|nr:pyridine nucleotide-disulfide oxidoreductase [Dongiaceae bacterium]
MAELRLAHGLRFEELYDPAGVAKIDALFLAALRQTDEGLAGRLLAARAEPKSLDAKAESSLIIETAPHLDDFLGELFGIAAEVADLRRQHSELAPIYAVKRLFVQRRALKAHPEAEANSFDADAIRTELTGLFGGTF